MLIVNTDTYILTTDCSTYLAAHYISTDTKLLAWTALSSDNKDILLRKAAQIIDRQPLTGFKALATQTMEFPRAIYTDNGVTGLNNMFYGDEWYIEPSAPDAVKYAQCEIAIELVGGVSAREELQRDGVKSFSLGNLSETYSGAQNNIISYEAKQLLAPYMGGLRIC